MNKMTLNIKNLFVGVAFATAMTGCVDMDVTPPASISPDTFWKTEKDAWYGLNACYAYMPGCDVFRMLMWTMLLIIMLMRVKDRFCRQQQ